MVNGDYPDAALDAARFNRLPNTILIDSLDFSAHTNLDHHDQTPIQTWNFILTSSQYRDLPTYRTPKLTFSIAKEIPTDFIDFLDNIIENTRLSIRKLTYNRLHTTIQMSPNYSFGVEASIKPLFLYINKNKEIQPFSAKFINKSTNKAIPKVFSITHKYLQARSSTITGTF